MNLERLSRVFAGIEPIGPIDYGAKERVLVGERLENDGDGVITTERGRFWFRASPLPD